VYILAAANDTEADTNLCARWLCDQNPRFHLTVLDDGDHYAFLGPTTENGAAILSGLVTGLPPEIRERTRAEISAAILDRISQI
jgi:hypothetical protein